MSCINAIGIYHDKSEEIKIHISTNISDSTIESAMDCLHDDYNSDESIRYSLVLIYEGSIPTCFPYP